MRHENAAKRKEDETEKREAAVQVGKKPRCRNETSTSTTQYIGSEVEEGGRSGDGGAECV